MRAAADTTARHRATIRRLAEQSFREHVLADLGIAGDTRIFRCERPGTRMYSFRVVLWPYWIVVAGDIGDTMFQHAVRDSLAWLQLASGDASYMLGKVRGARKIFMMGDAEAFLEERPQQDRADCVREAWRAGDDSPESFHRACRDADIDDPPDCLDYDSDHVWAVEALLWFARALPAERPVDSGLK